MLAHAKMGARGQATQPDDESSRRLQEPRLGRAAALMLALSSCSLLLLAAELLGLPLVSAVGAPLQRSLAELRGRARNDRQDELDRIAADYVSPRDPPLGFEHWIRFATENRCHLGPYDKIEADLAVFRKGGNGTGAGISKSQLEAAKRLPRVVSFAVRGGRVHFSSEGENRFGPRFSGLMKRFSEYLPNLEFVASDLDEPRVLPGTEDGLAARLASAQCAGASEDFRLRRHLHGFVNSRVEGGDYQPTKQLLPVFSQSKIDGCYADITYPTLYGLDNLLSAEQERTLLPWRMRNGTLFFRGATSGGHYRAGMDFRISHRQRLVDLARDEPGMDIAFSSIVQCEASVCEKMRQHYGTAEWVDPMDVLKYKYLMSVDGNTFVSRLPLLMSAGALVFRAGIFSEWYDAWLAPGAHFLPVRLDYSDLGTRLAWAAAHDGEAHMIGQRARRFARDRLRNEDAECYLFRLLLEYAALLER